MLIIHQLKNVKVMGHILVMYVVALKADIQYFKIWGKS